MPQRSIVDWSLVIPHEKINFGIHSAKDVALFEVEFLVNLLSLQKVVHVSSFSKLAGLQVKDFVVEGLALHLYCLKSYQHLLSILESQSYLGCTSGGS